MTVTLALAPSGVETWSLIDAAGAEHSLADRASFWLTAKLSGQLMPPAAVVTDPVPFRAGSRLRRANIDERVLSVPLLVAGATYVQARDRLSQLAGWLDPSRGDVRLRVTRPDATQRELVCRYRAGLEAATGPLVGEPHIQAVLEFLAADPLWQAIADTLYSWTVPPTSAGFFPFTFPLRLPSSTIWVLESIDNSAGYDRQDAWPVWTLVGPGVDPVLRNLTTGKTLTIAPRTLTSQDRLVIDTRPGVKSITDGFGSAVFPYPGSTLWPLVRGINQVQVELAGGVAGVSSISMAYRPKFLGP